MGAVLGRNHGTAARVELLRRRLFTKPVPQDAYFYFHVKSGVSSWYPPAAKVRPSGWWQLPEPLKKARGLLQLPGRCRWSFAV